MVFFLFLLLSILFFIFFAIFSRKFSHLPPGPWAWPIMGNLLMLGKDPHLTLTHWAERYGPLMHLQLGSFGTVVASSPTMAKEFLKTHDHVFQYRPSKLTFKILNKNWSMGVASGPTLRHMRKICTNALLTQKRLQSFQPMRSQEIQEAIKEIYRETNEGKVVNLSFTLSSLTTNHMTQMLFKKRYSGTGNDTKEAQWFREIIDAITRWHGVFIIGDYIPYLRWVTKLQGIDKSLEALRDEISNFVTRIMDEHRTIPSTPNSNIEDVAPDFVDILFTLPREDGTGHLTDDAIQGFIMLTFCVFADTSTVTLEWAMAELLQHPDIMKRVQAELDNVVGRNRLVEESDLQNLPYLQAILKENFRIHPPAPLMIPHCSIESSQVQGYNLPANTRVLVNLWAMGRDPKIWANPLQFDPNRFMEHDDIDMQGRNFELLPFGTGKRACPGRPLAVLIVQIALARLLQSFDYSIPKVEQEPIDMSATFGLSLKKTNAVCVVAHPRLQAHFYD
ncbi:unnamed protein product [Sphagnum compactum]